jgi:CRISPR-associated protein Csd1
LIKLVLLSNSPDRYLKERSLTERELEGYSAPYLCGKLFALLENAQRSALRGVNTTIVDRYFSKASTAPSLVFGPLLVGAQAHLAKLERDNPGAYHSIQAEIEMLTDKLQSRQFPRALRPEEQGEFVLGYYQQRARMRAEMLERRDERARQSAANPTN